MFALGVAMDELADAVGLDPVELRVRNEPEPTRRPACPGRAGTSSSACAPAPSGSAGTGAARAGLAPRGRLAGRHSAWRARRTRPTHAGQARRRGRARRRRPLRGADRRRRHRHRRLDGAHPDRRRRAAGARRRGRTWRSATPRCRWPPSPAARRALASWGSARGRAAARQVPRRARRRRPPAGAETEAGDGRGPRRTSEYAAHSFGAQFVEARVQRRHRRDPRAAAARRVLRAAGSSTRAPPARSSSAA